VPVASIRRLVRLTPVRSKDCVFHSFAFSTKDYVQYQLLLENEEESRRIFHLLESLAFPPSLDHMFAFAYRYRSCALLHSPLSLSRSQLCLCVCVRPFVCVFT
jgi:hypothetical protein